MSIVYLLGAGASSFSLPMASNLSDDIKKTVSSIQSNLDSKNSTPGMPFPKEKHSWPIGEVGIPLLQDMDWLGDITSRHYSVDTYAKKLWIRNDDPAKLVLYKLKCVLNCYFLYKHMSSFSDKRYDSFYSRILNRKEPGRPLFPKEINILSWNYDALLEKAYIDYCNNPKYYIDDIFNSESVYKLNGCVLDIKKIDDKKKITENIKIEEVDGKNAIDSIIQLYKDMTSVPFILEPGIHFAWETENLDPAKRIISDCSTLIIIGYSFPYFNKSIDREILKAAQKLENVYFQCKNDTGSIERMKTMLFEIRHPARKSITIKNIEDTEYFFIP